jgi:hypothetical protein
MSGKCHIEHISSKLCVVCYIIRSIKQYMSLKTLKMVYHSYFNSIINCGLPFWGHSPKSIKIYRMQNYILELCWVADGGTLAELYLENWKFYLWHLSTYFLLCSSLQKNRNEFIVNSEIHGINAGQQNNLHQPQQI